MTIMPTGSTPPGMPPMDAGGGSRLLVWGDTLSQIARELGTTVEELMRLNPQINNPDVIYAGDTIRVPEGSGQAPGAPGSSPEGGPGGPGMETSPGTGGPEAPIPEGAAPTSGEGTSPAGDRSWYLAQPGAWQCGPTSLTMALADWGVRPANLDTMNEMVGLTGANSSVGVPGNASLIAGAARQAGMQAEFNPSGDVNEVRKALESGKTVVLNGGLPGGGGHFIYVKGIDANGNYIIGDPARPGITTMTHAELQSFSNGTGQNPPGFAAIWR